MSGEMTDQERRDMDDVERSVLTSNIALLTPYAYAAKGRGMTPEEWAAGIIDGILQGREEMAAGVMVSPSGASVDLDGVALSACLRAVAVVSSSVWGVDAELHRFAHPITPATEDGR